MENYPKKVIFLTCKLLLLTCKLYYLFIIIIIIGFIIIIISAETRDSHSIAILSIPQFGDIIINNRPISF